MNLTNFLIQIITSKNYPLKCIQTKETYDHNCLPFKAEFEDQFLALFFEIPKLDFLHLELLCLFSISVGNHANHTHYDASHQ